MQINRDNYEIFLIDYLDGKLNKAQMQMVDAFLLANPDIALEFETLQTFTPVADAITFDQKDQLLKIPYAKAHADDDFFTTKCIEKIEGILPVPEEPAFEKMVEKSPAAFRSYSLFRKTRLPLEHFDYDEKIVIKINESHPVLNETNFAGYAIAYAEGWLNPEAQAAVNRYLKNNPGAEHTFKTIQNLKLIPDNQIVFPGKEALKKQLVVGQQFRKQLTYWGSVAAVITIGAFAFYMTDSQNQHLEQAMVKNETVHKKAIKQPATILTETKESQKTVASVQVPMHKPVKETVAIKTASVSQVETTIPKPEEIQIKAIPSIAFNAFKTNSELQPDLLEPDEIQMAKEKELLAAHYQLINSNATADSTPIDKLLKKAVRYGINKLIAASHGRIKIQQKENENKTKIEVETRYFAFSTTKQINF